MTFGIEQISAIIFYRGAKVTIKKNVLKKLKKGKKVTYQATYLKDTVKRTAKVKK